MQVRNLILESINEAKKSLYSNPFDWTASKTESQVRFYNILKKYIKGKINISKNGPIPPYKNAFADRIRLDYELTTDNGETLTPDIVIFKENSNSFNLTDTEALIKIRTGWGFNKKHLTGIKIINDYINLKNCSDSNPDLGYFIYFFGNEFDKMDKQQKDYYIRMINQFSKEYDLNKDNIFLIFRDKVIQPFKSK